MIILCGINDVKTCFLQGKIFAEKISRTIGDVIKEIKAVVGRRSSCCGESIAHRAFVSNPLREVILKLNDCWDGQKEKVAKKLGKGKALFINSPTLKLRCLRMNDTVAYRRRVTARANASKRHGL